MLLFTALASCSVTHLALEYAYKPSTMEGTNLQNFNKYCHSARSLNVSSEYDLVTEKATLTPGLAHDFHLFFEKDFNFADCSFVVEREKEKFFQGLESAVDEITLASLFYGTLLGSKHKPQANAFINVSCRDYFDEGQRGSLNQICCNLGYKTRVIPESLASILEGAMYLPDGANKNMYCLNFRGSQTVSSLYELKKEKDRVFASLVETKPVNIISDYEIERLVAGVVAEALRRDGIAFLPYFGSSELKYYADIQPEVMKIIDLLSSELEEHLILEVPYYERESNNKVSAIIERKVVLDVLRQKIKAVYFDGVHSSEQYQTLMREIPQGAELCVLTDVSLRGGLMKEFTLIPNEFVVKGLNQAHNDKIVLLDSRICSSYRPVLPAYSLIVDELKFRKETKKALDSIPSLIKELKNLSPDEVKEMEKHLTRKPRTLGLLREIVLEWDGLVRLDSKREADSILRAPRIKDLDDCLVEVRALMDSLDDSMRANIQSTFSETETWLEGKREDMSESKEFEIRSVKLRSIMKFIRKKLDEKSNREKTSENGPETDGKEMSDGILEQSRSTTDQKSGEESENELSAEKIGEVCEKSMNSQADENSGKTPKESEAISIALEEVNQREVL